jgi:hypothetical protein
MLVATRTFIDPSDGQPIEAGKTYVHESADVARTHRQNFRPTSARISGGIDRIDQSVQVGRPRPRVAPKRPAKKTPASASSRPYWLLGENEPWRLR